MGDFCDKAVFCKSCFDSDDRGHQIYSSFSAAYSSAACLFTLAESQCTVYRFLNFRPILESMEVVLAIEALRIQPRRGNFARQARRTGFSVLEIR
jgi:hypothetical protein